MDNLFTTIGIPSMIVAFSLGGFFALVRKSINDLKTDLEKQNNIMNGDIKNIKKTFVDEEKHSLICQNNTLLLEKLFNENFETFKRTIMVTLNDQHSKIVEEVSNTVTMKLLEKYLDNESKRQRT